MASDPYKLDRIRVQTARMLEIYSLVRSELERNSNAQPLHATERDKLNRAINTIAANMQQLQTYFTTQEEESSPAPAPPENSVGDELPTVDGDRTANKGKTAELDELVDAVLKWHMEQERDTSSPETLGEL